MRLWSLSHWTTREVPRYSFLKKRRKKIMDCYGFHLVSFRKSKTIFIAQSSKRRGSLEFDNDSPEEGKGGRKKLYNAQTPP